MKTMNENRDITKDAAVRRTRETGMRSIIASFSLSFCLLASGGVALAHTQNNAPAADANKAKELAALRLSMAAQNLASGKLNLERAKKAAELGDLEAAIKEIVQVQMLSKETDRLAAEARELFHSASAHVAMDPNAPAKPGLDAAAELRKAALEAAILQTRCCDVAFVNKAAHDLMKAEFEKQLESVKKDLVIVETEGAELKKAALAWDDVDTTSKNGLAKVVEEFAPSLKAALALFEKMARVALATIDYTVDGSDEHYATLTKEGTTSAKVVGALTVEGGGAAAKFTEDLDELGVPTMNKNFKTAKAKLESIARVGERLVNAALSVLKPTVRAKVKEKALADYAKLVGGAKDKLVAVVTEIKKVQEKLGGGSGDASGAAEGGGESESAVQAE